MIFTDFCKGSVSYRVIPLRDRVRDVVFGLRSSANSFAQVTLGLDYG